MVAGAGLSATDCGGITRTPGEDDGSGGGGNGGAGTATGSATSTGGVRPGTGGRSVTPTGGAGGILGSGGTTATPTGGVPASGGAPLVSLPPPQTLAQWDCTGLFQVCTYIGSSTPETGYTLSRPCKVDPPRPRTALDCAPGEWFSCQSALARLTSEATPILVNCECVAMGDAGCAGCDDAYCVDARQLCGCAQPGILR